MENFITKKVGGLPVWAWGLIGVAGIGIGYFIIHKPGSGIPTGTQASDTSAGDVQADAIPADLQPSNAPVGPGDPFMSVPVGQGTVPVLPNGYNPVYDANGNLTGYQAPAPPPTGTPPASQIFTGPTGVKHYVVQQGDTLSSIAARFVPGGGWNSIYAIPANQHIFGAMDANHAKFYAPRAGTVITLPGNARA